MDQEIGVNGSIKGIKDTSKFRPKGTDKRKVAALKEANPNLSTYQIGKIVGIDASQVCRVLQEYGLNEQRTNEYKSNRADVFAGLQSRILAIHLSDEAIKKLPPSVAPLWFNSLFNNERLERGQSTQIVDGFQAAIKRIEVKLSSEKCSSNETKETIIEQVISPEIP